MSYVNLQMMLADAPRYISGKRAKTKKPLATADDEINFFSE
jgi:hypothetical protein